MIVWGVVGWKNSGKTGLMERLVAAFVARGVTVSTVKHAHHSADLDRPGSDSDRHRMAGAGEVLLSSPARVAVLQELRGAPEPGLPQLLTRLQPVDLVLVEGFKTASHPKIEAHRAATGQPLIAPTNPTVRAVASDSALEVSCPCFDLDDTDAIVAFIAAEAGL